MIGFRSLTAGVIVAGLLVGGVASAQGPRGGGPGGVGRGAGPRANDAMPLRSLNLTEAQQDLIRDIRERHRQEAEQLHVKLRELQRAQRTAVDAVPFNEAQVRQAALAAAEVHAELAVHQARMQNEIFAALTPAQQEQLRKARAEREQRLEQRQTEMQQRAQQRRQSRP